MGTRTAKAWLGAALALVVGTGLVVTRRLPHPKRCGCLESCACSDCCGPEDCKCPKPDPTARAQVFPDGSPTNAAILRGYYR